MKNRVMILLATLLFCVLLSVQAVPVGSSGAVATLASALQVSVEPGSPFYAPDSVAELHGTVIINDYPLPDAPVTVVVFDPSDSLWNRSLMVTGSQGNFSLAIRVPLYASEGRYTVLANTSFARAAATAATSFVVSYPTVWIETDKPAYFPGENVTITLLNADPVTLLLFSYLPPIDIYTYYGHQAVYPGVHADVILPFGAGETWTDVWDQRNVWEGRPADPGLYIVEVSTVPATWSSAIFVIIGPGDLNHNGGVDIADIVLASSAYGTQEGDANWNPEADVAPPYGIVNLCDIMTLVYRYGQSQ